MNVSGFYQPQLNTTGLAKTKEYSFNWVYLVQNKSLVMELSLLDYLGLETSNSSQIMSLDTFLKYFKPSVESRFLRIFAGYYETDHVFEELEVLHPKQQGERLLMTGGVVSRSSDGRIAMISGVISQSASGLGRFFNHAIKSDGLWEWNGVTGELNYSQSYKLMLGYGNCPQLFPSNYDDWVERIVHPEDRANTLAKQLAVVENSEFGNYFESCIRIRHLDGHYIWTLGRGVVLERDAEGKATRIVGYNTDINIIANVLDQNTSTAYTDVLTGFYNRRYLDEQRSSFESTSNQPLGLVYMDITGLKLVNDYLGYREGDLIIQKVSSILSSATKDIATLFRLGGDELVALIPRCNELRIGMIITSIEQLLKAYNQKQGSEDSDATPVISGLDGAIMGEEGTSNVDALLALADKRCQEKKQQSQAKNLEIMQIYIKKRLGKDSLSFIDERLVDDLASVDNSEKAIDAQKDVLA